MPTCPINRTVVSVEDTEACCCGVAGVFGYEVEHAELSRIIASQRLLPLLDKISAGTRVATDEWFLLSLPDRRAERPAIGVRDRSALGIIVIVGNSGLSIGNENGGYSDGKGVSVVFN